MNRHQGRANAASALHYAITSRADLERACAAMASMQSPALPIFRAAADGKIALAFIHQPEMEWPTGLLATFSRPVLVVISDDLEPERASSSPAEWRCAEQLQSWANTAIVHGAGAEAAHYRLAAAAAAISGRAALVETNSTHAREWAAVLKHLSPLLIIPRDDGMHPIATPRDTLQ